MGKPRRLQNRLAALQVMASLPLDTAKSAGHNHTMKVGRYSAIITHSN